MHQLDFVILSKKKRLFKIQTNTSMSFNVYN